MKGPGYAIGLFQGMFDKNILTFNPGWDAEAQAARSEFMDVREMTGRHGWQAANSRPDLNAAGSPIVATGRRAQYANTGDRHSAAPRSC